MLSFPESSIPKHNNFKLHFELQKAYLNRGTGGSD